MKRSMFLASVTIIALLGATVFSYGQGCCKGGSGSADEGGSSCHKSSDSKSSRSAKINKYALNGGAARRVGKYNIEMVFNPLFQQDPLNFYLMNKRGKPVSNQGIKASAEITYMNGAFETITIEPRSENRFAGQLTNKSRKFTCLLTLQINGENVTVSFVQFNSSSKVNENVTATK